MHKSLIVILKILPLPFVYFMMALVTPFYLIFNHKSYIAIYHYFRRRHGYTPLKSFWNVCRNYLVFGTVVMDRFAVYAGRKFRIVADNMEVFNDLLATDKAFMFVSSHVGCNEMAGYTLKSPRRINSLVFSGEARVIQINRSRVMTGNNIRLIPIAEDMSHLVILNNAIAGGEVVGIHGDRLFGSGRSVKCELLGKEAAFPRGPFSLAVIREIPAVAIFVMKEGLKKYHVYLYALPSGDAALPRREREEIMARAYVSRLDAILRKYPRQWFNYYEFWND